MGAGAWYVKVKFIVSLLQLFDRLITTILSPSSRVRLEQLNIPLFESNVNGTAPPLSEDVIPELLEILDVAILM